MERFAGNSDHGKHAVLSIIMVVAMASTDIFCAVQPVCGEMHTYVTHLKAL